MRKRKCASSEKATCGREALATNHGMTRCIRLREDGSAACIEMCAVDINLSSLCTGCAVRLEGFRGNGGIFGRAMRQKSMRNRFYAAVKSPGTT